MMKQFLALLWAAVIALASPPSVNAQPEAQTLNVGTLAQPNTLNPLLSSLQIEQYLFSAVFSGLTTLDEQGRIVPDLARDVPSVANGGISTDGKSVTYRLRPNLKWQDGEPLTSRDVAFTLAKMRDPAVGFPARSRYDFVDRIETPNAQTVVVRLKARSPDAVATLFVNGQNGSIVPEHLLSAVTDMQKAAFSAKPVGSGPYRVDSWERGSELVLRANPNFFRGPARIDTIVVKFFGDGNTQTIGLKTGTVDLVYDASPGTLPLLQGNPRVRVVPVPSDSVAWFIVNTTARPFDDPRVRQALALAVDRDVVVRNVYRGFARPADDLIPPWSPFHTPNPRLLKADLDLARKLLNEAGWQAGSDGIRTKDGARLAITLTTVAGSPQRQTMAVIFQAAWKTLGADVSIRSLPINALVAPDGVLPRGDFQIALLGYAFPVTADRTNLLSSSSVPPHGFNYPRLRDTTLDGLLARSMQTDNGPARVEIFHEIAGIVAQQDPFVPIVWITNAYAVANDLQGFKPGPDAALFWNAWEWRLANRSR